MPRPLSANATSVICLRSFEYFGWIRMVVALASTELSIGSPTAAWKSKPASRMLSSALSTSMSGEVFGPAVIVGAWKVGLVVMPSLLSCLPEAPGASRAGS